MSTLDVVIVVLYSYLPALAFGLFFWWLDRFERESLILCLVVFFWGAYVSGYLSFFFNTFISVYLDIYANNDRASNDIITAVMVAPLVEESTKGSIVLILYALGKVDNVTDGILFGVLSGLGFAASENVFYALDMTYKNSGEMAMWQNLWFRELHTTLLHASATAVWGAMISYARYFKGFSSYFTLLNGFVLAMVTHGLWNFIASMTRAMSDDPSLLEYVAKFELIFIGGFLLVLFLMSVRNESRIIVRELSEEAENGVLPREHVGFFASLVRHPKHFNLPKNIPYKHYAQLGVKLAFHKDEYRFNPTNKLQQQIRHLRQMLKQTGDYAPDSLNLHYGK